MHYRSLHPVFFFALSIMVTCFSYGQKPFVCDGNYFLVLTPSARNSLFHEVLINPSTGAVEFQRLSNVDAGLYINGVGYRSTDDFMYGIDPVNQDLYQVDATGRAFFLAPLVFNRQGNNRFVAGDVSPDGRFLVLLGGSSFRDNIMVFVDLTSANYTASVLNLSGDMVNCADIAFDPFSGLVYGFDGNGHRLVTYDPGSGLVRANFPASRVADAMGAIYFDAFGKLYGYGRTTSGSAQNTFFEINKQTGEVTVATAGPEVTRSDGISCPYTIKLREWTDPIAAVPCTEVEINIEISNASGYDQSGLVLEQVFPETFKIVRFENTIRGNLTAGGAGTNFFRFEEVFLTPGLHSMSIIVELLPSALGRYDLQATLSNLPARLGGATLSDNPFTLIVDDPAVLEVGPLQVDFSNTIDKICSGDQITLNAFQPGVKYLWQDGSTKSSLLVDKGGDYSVTITSGCDMAFGRINVEEIELAVDLPERIEIQLGDSVRLRPATIPFSEGYFFDWTSTSKNPFCTICETPFVRPFFDSYYTVAVTNGLNCFAVDSVLVVVKKERDVFLPNAFSPNGDGFNDVYYLQSRQAQRILTLQIFNRWGGLVFEQKEGWTNDNTFSWDGRLNGRPLDPAVFIVAADIVYLDGIVERYYVDLALVK